MAQHQPEGEFVGVGDAHVDEDPGRGPDAVFDPEEDVQLLHGVAAGAVDKEGIQGRVAYESRVGDAIDQLVHGGEHYLVKETVKTVEEQPGQSWYRFEQGVT